ncbi:MAG: thioredoxin [Spirochaetaceae bacterium]|nr:thioredoxin [Spirochaetaceae bacterium]
MASQVTITNDNFEAEVEKSEVPVLIDFWAEWCMPCKMVSPVVAEIAQAYDGKLKVGKIDVDAEGDLAARFNVMSIPTLIVFNGGEVVAQRVGAVPRPAIEALFKELV